MGKKPRKLCIKSVYTYDSNVACWSVLLLRSIFPNVASNPFHGHMIIKQSERDVGVDRDEPRLQAVQGSTVITLFARNEAVIHFHETRTDMPRSAYYLAPVVIQLPTDQTKCNTSRGLLYCRMTEWVGESFISRSTYFSTRLRNMSIETKDSTRSLFTAVRRNGMIYIHVYRYRGMRSLQRSLDDPLAGLSGATFREWKRMGI